MSQTFKKIISITLVLCVLAIGGLAQAQAAEHAGHHAQHQAATHGTLLCSWMCAAGTVLDSQVVLFQAEHSPIAILQIFDSADTISQFSRIYASRGPPSLFL
ncbi:MAG: hypothetical protein JSR31_03970 [Nitrospira sp.]|nr:hypothetical protein [Nitrospira sp.]